MTTSLRLLGRRVLVARFAQVEETRGGLFLPSAARELPQLGVVVYVGSFRNGQPLPVKVDDVVMFPKHHDRFVVLDGVQLLDLRDDELLMKID